MPDNAVGCGRTTRTLSMALSWLSHVTPQHVAMVHPFRACAHLGLALDALLATQCWLVPLLLLSQWLVDPLGAALRACRGMGNVHDAVACAPIPTARAMQCDTLLILRQYANALCNVMRPSGNKGRCISTALKARRGCAVETAWRLRLDALERHASVVTTTTHSCIQVINTTSGNTGTADIQHAQT
jgi:hypothetical protein